MCWKRTYHKTMNIFYLPIFPLFIPFPTFHLTSFSLSYFSFLVSIQDLVFLFIYLFASQQKYLSVLWSELLAATSNLYHLLSLKSIFLTQFPALFLIIVTVSHYVKLRKVILLSFWYLLIFFTVFQSWVRREEFPTSNFDLEQISLWVQGFCNDAAKNLLDLLQSESVRHKFVKAFLFFYSPAMQRGVGRAPWPCPSMKRKTIACHS